MQRRTNLFYTSGQDSNFITFSNYTESLTGSFISTDWKLFPSKFVCIKVDFTEELSKEAFIKHIASYYENKLAFVRDWCINNNLKIERNTLPFEWLLEEFVKFFGEDNVHITFISEIVEQNFNGVYADTICTITGTDIAKTYTLHENPAADTTDTHIPYGFSKRYLYGWYLVEEHSGSEGSNGSIDYNEETSNSVVEEYTGSSRYDDEVIIKTEKYTGPSEYETVVSVFDGYDELRKPYYSLFPKYDEITISGDLHTSIDFNIVVPLFDLTNLNTKTNVNVINETIDLTSQVADNDTEDRINIPLGIWFADELISLKRDGNTGYAPSWSLVLSSQFKPFPYSSQLTADGVEGPQGIAYTEGAYVTFAQILARQNEMISTFSQLSAQIANLSSKIEAVDAKINQMGTSYAIDGIHKEMVLFKNQITNLLEQYGVSSDTSLTWDAKFNG